MTTSLRCAALLAAAVCSLGLAGCNSEGIHPVKGQVIWKDTQQPATELANSLISFEQKNTETSARGQIKPDGSFQLTTNKENDGAKLGEHVVLITEIGRLPSSTDPTQLAPGKIGIRYADPKTSDLRCTIKPGMNEVKLEVERFENK